MTCLPPKHLRLLRCSSEGRPKPLHEETACALRARLRVCHTHGYVTPWSSDDPSQWWAASGWGHLTLPRAIARWPCRVCPGSLTLLCELLGSVCVSSDPCISWAIHSPRVRVSGCSRGTQVTVPQQAICSYLPSSKCYSSLQPLPL